MEGLGNQSIFWGHRGVMHPANAITDVRAHTQAPDIPTRTGKQTHQMRLIDRRPTVVCQRRLRRQATWARNIDNQWRKPPPECQIAS